MVSTKIILINPPAPPFRFAAFNGSFPPLGLAYIAGVLEHEGYDVKILDMPALRLNIKKTLKILLQEKAEVVGIGYTIFNIGDGAALAKSIKEKRPKTKIVVGGPCTIIPPEFILKKVSAIDIVIKGEGEHKMLEVCRALKKSDSLKEIKGIAFRQNKKIYSTKEKKNLIDLDKLPLPAKHLLLNEGYTIHQPYGLYPPSTAIETARGCPYNCIYCVIPKRVRFRSPKLVVDEVEYNIKKYGIKEIFFVDPAFTLDEDKVKNICKEIISRNIKIKWKCATRVDLVTYKLLKLMKQAGCYAISYGVESGSQKILDNLNKEVSVEQIKKAIVFTRKAGIMSIACLLMGSIGETEETIRQTIRLMKEAKPDFVSYSELKIVPGTRLHKLHIEKGRLKEGELEEIYLSGDLSRIPGVVFKGLSEDGIRKWMIKGYKTFYLNPRYILYRILRLHNLGEIRVMFSGFLNLLRDLITLRRGL